MNEITQAVGRKNSRELIAFAFVEEAYARTGDLVAGLLPLFTPLLAKKVHRRFDPVEFADEVERAYDIPMSPLVASGLVEKLAEAKLLTLGEIEPNTYRIAACREDVASFDEEGMEGILAEFSTFTNESLTRIGLGRQERDVLDVEFLHRLTTAQFLSFTERREKNYYHGKTLTIKRVEDDEQDAIQLEQALDVLTAEFVLRKLEASDSAAELLTRLMTGALIAEVVLTLQAPSSIEALGNLTVVFDGPLVLDFMDLSTPELRDYANDLFTLVEKATTRKVIFKHTLEEMKGTLRGPLDTLRRGEKPFGPLGNRIRLDSSHAAYAREALNDLEQRVAKLGFEIVDADLLATDERLKFCDAATEEGLRNNIGPILVNLDRRIRDAHSIATILRQRGGIQSPKSIADALWVLVTRNDAVAAKSQGYLVMRKIITRDDVPPAITDKRLAGYLWFSVGGNLGALSRKKLVANCSAVMTPRTDVVSKVRQYLEELDPKKAALFIALMRDQRAQRCLVQSTLAFPSAITPDNAEQLLEEVRLSVAAEVRAEAEKQQAELNRKHEGELTNLTASHQDELLVRGAELLALKNEFGDHKKASAAELEKRTNEITGLNERLISIESSVKRSIDSRIQRAARRATREIFLLRLAAVPIYLVIVGCAYWFMPTKNEYRLYALIATVIVALLGTGLIAQIAYDKFARPIWMRRLASHCNDLDVAEHLELYEVDSKKMGVTRVIT